VRNPFRRSGGFLLGNGFYLGRQPRDAKLKALQAKWQAAETQAAKNAIDAQIQDRLREIDHRTEPPESAN